MHIHINLQKKKSREVKREKVVYDVRCVECVVAECVERHVEQHGDEDEDCAAPHRAPMGHKQARTVHMRGERPRRPSEKGGWTRCVVGRAGGWNTQQGDQPKISSFRWARSCVGDVTGCNR